MSENKGEITYEIRADDSHLEADLDAAEKKVKKSAEQTAQAAEKVEEQSSEVKKEIKEDVTKHHQEENRKQEESDEDSHQKREESAKGHGEKLKSIASGTAKAIGAAFVAAGTATVAVGTMAISSANDMDKAMNQFIASTGTGVEETERYKKVMEDIYTSNYGESFEDIGEAMSQVIKQLGDMPDEQLKQVTESAYALRDVFEYDIPETTRAAKALMDNFGISGEEAMNLIAAGAQNGLDYSGELIDSISEYSAQFAKVGLDADDMFKIFQKGADTGAWNLDKIGDAIKEFSIRAIDGSDVTKEGFSLLGYSASASAEEIADAKAEIEKLEQQLKYAQIEQAGFNSKTSELTKIKSADKIAEYSQKLEAAKENLAQLTASTEESGKSMDELIQKFGKGGDDAHQAFQEIVGAIAAMEDPLEQNAAGVALFGTMWEDLGPDVVTQLVDIGDAAYATGEELNSIKDVKYDDLGSMLEGLKRSVEVLLIPLGEQLIPVLSELIDDVLPLLQEALPPILDLVMVGIESILPVVQEILPVLLSLFEELMPVFQQVLEKILPVFIELLNEFLPILGDLISEFLPVVLDLFIALLDPLMDLISILLPPLLELFDALMPVLNMLISLLIPIIQLFVELLAPILGIITEAIGPLIAIISVLLEATLKPLQKGILRLGEVFSEILNGIFKDASSIIQDVIKIFRGLIDFVAGIFTGDWDRAWKGIVDVFSGWISGISTSFKIPINFVIDGINGFLNGINGIEIPEWVPVVGGMSFNIPLIPRLKKGMDFVPSDYFPAYLDYGERVLTQQENMIYTALGGVEGMRGMERDINVTVENPEGGFDYERMGDATAKAIDKAGLTVRVDKREFGRVVREVQN